MVGWLHTDIRWQAAARYQILRPPNHKSFRRLLAVIVQSTQQLLLEKWTDFFQNCICISVSGTRLYFLARARCISCMLWELFATPASELLPLIRCPHPHFFAEGTDSQTLSATNPDFFSQKIFPKQGLISSDGGKCYCRTVGWVGSLVLNIVIFLQLHGGTRTVPQRGDVKTTNSRNSDEQQQELGNKKNLHWDTWPIRMVWL